MSDDSEFRDFMNLVDLELVQRMGFTHNDMPDLYWRDMFDNELTPEEAAQEAIEEWEDDGDIPRGLFA
jgi:hypothetical protein